MYEGVSCRPNDQRGFLHKKIIGFGARLLGIGSSIIPGPAGAVLGLGARGLGAVSGGGRQAPQPITNPFDPSLAQLPPGFRVQIPKAGIGGAVQRFLPGGATGFTTLPQGLIPRGPGGAIGLMPGVPGGVTGFGQNGVVAGQCAAPVMGGNRRVNAAGQVACPGFHWNETTYTRLGGPCSNKPAGLVVKGTEQVKNRRKFNTANGPARKRAAARLKASEKDCKEALRAIGFRTISKQSSREMRMRRRGHR